MNGGDARATAYTFSATIKISAKTLEAMLWWFQICKSDGWSGEDQDGDAVGEHRRTCVASVLDWLVLDFLVRFKLVHMIVMTAGTTWLEKAVWLLLVSSDV